MKVTLKLFATLGKYLPSGTKANVVEVEVPENATPNELIDRYNVPREMVHLVLLNGIYIEVDERDKVTMKPDDVLAVWPPVAGG